jgi:tetratricopeptide (TPR) repeat protein
VTDGNWRTLLREASQLRAAGRIPEAILAYRQLLVANPELADSWFNLGWLERQARQFEESLQSYQQAIEAGVAQPEAAHLNRAAIYSEYLHRPRDAQRELEAALAKNPAYVQALINLGNLHEDLGERAEAQAAYSRALEVDPANTMALAKLATASLSATLDRELEARLRGFIERPDSTSTQRAGLGFALSAMLDAAGEYDAAFDAVTAANASSRAASGSTGRYDRAAQEAFTNRLMATFACPVHASGDEPAPVFICGMYRSGSTLIEQILAGHSQVTATGELDLIPAIVASIPGYPERIASADPAIIAELSDFYRRGLPVGAGPVITDKRPDNFLHIGLIKTLFPRAKIVHTVRNPLDNLLSLYFLHLDPRMAYALDLEDAAHWYGQYQRLMAHWRSLYGDDIFEVDYDALVKQPEPIVRDLLAFLGLDWDPQILDFNRTDRAVKTASVWQVREPLYARSSGRWRNYEKHLEPLRKALSSLDAG